MVSVTLSLVTLEQGSFSRTCARLSLCFDFIPLQAVIICEEGGGGCLSHAAHVSGSCNLGPRSASLFKKANVVCRAVEKSRDFPAEDHALFPFPVKGRCTEVTSKFRTSDI